MRACIAASVLMAAGTALAGTELVVVVRPAADSAAEDAKRVAAALSGALADDPRFEPIDIELKAGGRRVGRAAREVGTARRDVARGVDALYDLRTAEAGELLRGAVAALRKHPARLLEGDVRALVDGLAHLAAIQLLEGNDRRGRDLIAEAVAMAPELEPDKRVFNPPMLRTFMREQERLDERLGFLSVTSSPRGAMVWVDGVARGVTPITVEGLREGAHVVRVVEDGRLSWGQRVNVVAKAAVEVRAELSPLANAAVERRIREAFLAADNKANAPTAAAALGRSVNSDQVMLARVRRLAAGRVAVDVVLYRVVDEVRVARASRELALAQLDDEMAALLSMLDVAEAVKEPGAVATDEFDSRLLAPSKKLDTAEQPEVLRTPVPAAPTDWDRVVAWSLTGGGAALAAGGLALAVHGDSVLGDATSLGEDKDTAVKVGFLGVGMAAVGVALSAWGGWMLWDTSE